MKRHALWVVTGLGLLAASSASAQEASVVEGPGYPVGEGSVLHPTLGAEVGFTSNVFYAQRAPNSSGLLRLIASAAIAAKEIEEAPIDPLLDDTGEGDLEPSTAKRKLDYRLGGVVRYDEYLTPQEHVREQRTLGMDLKGHVTANPEGEVAFTAEEHFVRDTRPTNFEAGLGEQNNRIVNNLGLTLRYQPGGRQIGGELRWQNQLDIFEAGDSQFANRMINSFGVRGDWKMFPFTRFLAEFNYSFIGGLGSNELNGMTFKSSSQPMRGGIGLQTVLTEVITVKAHLGWAYAGYSVGEGYNAPEVGAELGYRYAPNGRIVASYTWEHRDSVNSNYYRDHRLAGQLDQQFGARLLATGFADVRFRGYRGVPAVLGGGPSRDDLIFSIGARGSFVLRDTFAFVAQYRTDVDQTDYVSMFDGMADDPSYVRHEVTAGVRAAF